jgi:hypothetical protein
LLDQGGAVAGSGGGSGQGGTASGNGTQSDQGETASGNGSSASDEVGQQGDQNAENPAGQSQGLTGTEQLGSDVAQQGTEASKENSEKEGNGKIDPSLRLINTAPISVDQSIDEPVTSGGDAVVGDAPNPSN